ncbi:MAG: ATP-binding cassette domain-containing protein [Mycobacteriales bacterium]|nr:MAG: ABC transporter [Pseudonocardiales bacterium]
MSASVVHTTGLTKRYGERVVVDHLDLDVPAGVVAGVVGPNGAGKTTTMRMLLGLARVSSGEGTVLGRPISRPASYLSRVGALIESPAFYPALSGRRNLAVHAAIGGIDPRRIPMVLERVGLADRADDAYRAYSLGMKQRLGIAAALVGDPALLVLDEPTNGLDPAGIRSMRDLVRGLADDGPTVLLSSHLLVEVQQVCDWLVVIDHGRQSYQGPVDGILAGAVTELAIAGENTSDIGIIRDVVDRLGYDVQAHSTGAGDLRVVVPSDADPTRVGAGINRAVAGAGITLARIDVHRPTLEERYLTLTKKSA